MKAIDFRDMEGPFEISEIEMNSSRVLTAAELILFFQQVKQRFVDEEVILAHKLLAQHLAFCKLREIPACRPVVDIEFLSQRNPIEAILHTWYAETWPISTRDDVKNEHGCSRIAGN
jgi:hypothetical protein